MRKTVVVLLIASCVPALYLSAQSVPTAGGDNADVVPGFDTQIGIWYPPDAPRDVYRKGSDPAHSYGKDLLQALKADPDLRDRVCALGSKYLPDQERTEPRLLQMKTMFDMSCIAIAIKKEQKNEKQSHQRQVDEWFFSRLHLEQVQTLDKRTRWMQFESLVGELRFKRSFDLALRLIALRPEDDRGVYFALKLRLTQGAKGLHPEHALEERSVLPLASML